MNKKYIVRLSDAERQECSKIVSELKVIAMRLGH